MKFVCDRCQTRYSIADEKVRQKILRIRCKTCGNVIVVQGGREPVAASSAAGEITDGAEHFESAKTDATGAPNPVPTSASPKAAPTSAPKLAPSTGPRSAQSSAPKAMPAPAARTSSLNVPRPGQGSSLRAAPAATSTRPISANTPRSPTSSVPKYAPAGPKAPPAGPPPLPPPDAAGPDPLGGRVEWYLAIGGVRSGPFSRVEAAQKIVAADPGKTVHVWKEGMPGWKASDEVSVIARELSILRPAPPPPPPPEPVKPSPVHAAAPSAGLPKVAAMPPSVAKAVRASEVQPESLFPGKPLKPMLGGVSDSLDITLDTNPGTFSDITTKKAKKLQDLGSVPDKSNFTDVTTKKNRNLRDLEAEPLFSTAPAFSESEKTPPPASTLPSVAPQSVEPLPSSSSTGLPAALRSSSTNLPVAVRVSSTALPTVAPPSPSSQPSTVPSGADSPVAQDASPPQSDLGSFSDVIRAVAESEPPSSSAVPVFSPPTLSVSNFSQEISPDSQGPKGLAARPGLKYLVGAGVIVVLVILIVMVTLRMDSRKVPDPDPVPAATNQSAPTEQAKPVADEPAKPEPNSDEKNIQNVRASGRHGLSKPARHVDVGPSPERQQVAKQPAKPALPARPNPFDESKGPTVSQSQISAVVRSKVNQAGLKACYERALKMDNHLTSGRIDVTVSIGLSGMVQRVVINAPSTFIMVEPCIKTAVKRWVFPPSSEEYATNFPLIMQGGM